MNDPAVEAAVQQIEAGFADVAYPGDENLVRSDCVCRPEWYEVVLAFKGKHWRELTLKFLLYHHDALSVFTSEAYRYYLPAYLLVSILNYEEADILPEFVIYSLIRGEDVRDHEDFQQRVGGFTASQLQAVKSFLEFMKDRHLGDLGDDIDEALENLGTGKGVRNRKTL